MPITYTIGDATDPTGDGPKVICHICNDVGGWGAGFVLAISRRWEQPEKRYCDWFAGGAGEMPFELGGVQFVEVEPDLTIANMIGQHGIGRRRGGSTPQPVRYEAVREALRKVAHFALIRGASAHMPRIGAGLAGGDWATIEKIIDEELCARSVSVTVCDLPAR